MNKHIYRILLALVTLVLSACVNEMDFAPNAEGGRLRLSLANISTATTRTSPQDLGKPSAEDFRLRIINAAGRDVYDDIFTTEEITLPVGDYTVLATYGSNPLLAIDQPYYIGQATVTIEKDQTAEANITAKVGNALVSVIFGRDAEEQARFNRYYSDYALQVAVGSHSLDITKDNPAQSVYVQADSHVTLRFWGKLKMENDREVSCELTSDDFPETLVAAEHAIVTLSLPDPESALAVDISKVEVETVTLDETIPLSWLPVPTVVPTHKFDRQGNLVGTNLDFSNGYPGMNWKLEVTKKGETEVLRAEEGTGALSSSYTSYAEWPYLPQGTYMAVYYIVYGDGSSKKASSREFVIPAPTGLKVTVDGFSSYTKYLEGDIEGANACERLTIYEPSVSVNVATSLLKNSKYSYSFTYSYDGATASVAVGNNRYALDKLENQPVRSTPYILRGNLTFDGVSVVAQKEFRITGLPVEFAPPSESNGWSAETDCVTFNTGDVKLGNRGTILTDYNEYIINRDFYIPYGTKIELDYDTMIHPATQGTNLSFLAGDDAITVVSERGGVGNTTDYPRRGTAAITLTMPVTEMICKNSYGGGATCSYIYSLHYKYAQ